MKRLYLMSALMLILTGTASATNEILDLKNATILPDIKQMATIPTRDVVADSDGNVTVTYEFSKIRKVEDPSNILKISSNGSEQIAQYKIASICNRAYLLITDTNGKEYRQIPLTASEKIGEISLPSLNSGVYTVSLIVDEERVSEQRIIM